MLFPERYRTPSSERYRSVGLPPATFLEISSTSKARFSVSIGAAASLSLQSDINAKSLLISAKRDI
jgi:hypothetical protein